jgi:hypothetical protein
MGRGISWKNAVIVFWSGTWAWAGNAQSSCPAIEGTYRNCSLEKAGPLAGEYEVRQGIRNGVPFYQYTQQNGVSGEILTDRKERPVPHETGWYSRAECSHGVLRVALKNQNPGPGPKTWKVELEEGPDSTVTIRYFLVVFGSAIQMDEGTCEGSR